MISAEFTNAVVGNVGGEGRSNSVDNCSDNLIFIPRRTSKSIQAFVTRSSSVGNLQLMLLTQTSELPTELKAKKYQLTLVVCNGANGAVMALE